jgi:hypothetical protein
MDYILAHKDWIFSGIGVLAITLVLGVVKFFVISKKTEDNRPTSVNQSVSINLGDKGLGESKSKDSNSHDRAYVMATARILFIDDQTDFPVVKVIQKAGWKNVSIKKDIVNFSTPEILAVDIFFVDIQGVGKALAFSDEGLGLAKALKTHFGKKKKVIIYSAEPRGETFHEAWSLADGRLRKDAQPYEYLQLLDQQLGIEYA